MSLSTEAQALHAMIEGDHEEARRLMSTLTKTEAAELADDLNQLMELARTRSVGDIEATGVALSIERGEI